MKTSNFKSLVLGLLSLALLAIVVVACQKEEAEPVVEQDFAQTFENDSDVLTLVGLMEESANDALQALKKQGIGADEFKQLYERGNEQEIANTLKMDASVVFERNFKINELAQKINTKYPDLESRINDGHDVQVYQDPFTMMGQFLDSDGTSKDKCSGWRNWRNLGKYTVCLAACAVTAPTGWGYFLCATVCYFSFCT